MAWTDSARQRPHKPDCRCRACAARRTGIKSIAVGFRLHGEQAMTVKALASARGTKVGATCKAVLLEAIQCSEAEEGE